MISVLAFNLGLIMMVITWPLCYWINNGRYIDQYQYYLYKYKHNYFEGIYLRTLDIEHIMLLISAITAGLMFCDEIFSATFALFTNVTMASLISFHTLMITLAISCGIVIIELLLALLFTNGNTHLASIA